MYSVKLHNANLMSVKKEIFKLVVLHSLLKKRLNIIGVLTRKIQENKMQKTDLCVNDTKGRFLVGIFKLIVDFQKVMDLSGRTHAMTT